MDSVTDGTLWSADQHPQKDTEVEKAAANSTETTVEAEVWPPWENADRDDGIKPPHALLIYSNNPRAKK